MPNSGAVDPEWTAQGEMSQSVSLWQRGRENIAITDKAVRFTFVCLRIREGLLRGEFLQWLISVSMGMPLMADLILTTTLIITLSRSRSSFMRWVKLHSGLNLAERVSL